MPLITVSTGDESGTVLIGEKPDQCPWDWSDIRDVVKRGVIALDDIRHCPFCNRFFWVREGHPRRSELMGGRKCGTAACYKAWEFDAGLG